MFLDRYRKSNTMRMLNFLLYREMADFVSLADYEKEAICSIVKYAYIPPPPRITLNGPILIKRVTFSGIVVSNDITVKIG